MSQNSKHTVMEHLPAVKDKLLVCYEAGRENPRHEIHYRLQTVPEKQALGALIAATSLAYGKAVHAPFIPDMRMELYGIPEMTGTPRLLESSEAKNYIRGTLLPYIREEGIRPEVSVNLRDMVFARNENLLIESGGTLRLNAGQIDRLVEFRKEQDERAGLYRYISEYKRPFRIVETSKGMLVFSGNDTGWKGLDQFYRHLLNNYFSVTGETGPIRQYCVREPEDDLYRLVDRSFRKNPHSGKYAFDLLDSYARIPVNKNWETEFVTDMKPSASEYTRIEDFSGCRPEGNNKDICRLLFLCRSFDRDIILTPSFGYHFQFKPFVSRMDNCINNPDSTDSMGKIMDEIRSKAENILKTEFRVRGMHRPQAEKENRKTTRNRNNKLKL